MFLRGRTKIISWGNEEIYIFYVWFNFFYSADPKLVDIFGDWNQRPPLNMLEKKPPL
jgi:hypothetical protein